MNNRARELQRKLRSCYDFTHEDRLRYQNELFRALLADRSNLEARDAWVTDLNLPYAELTHDEVLGDSLLVCLPSYEGKREDVIVGLGDLESSRRDTIDNWLSSYTARADGVIVTPLRLTLAVAAGMESIRDVPLFASEVDAFRTYFQSNLRCVTAPAYGMSAHDMGGTHAMLDELSLDGQRVRREVSVPSWWNNICVTLAPEQEEGCFEMGQRFEDFEQPIEEITGYKNPGLLLQLWDSRTNGRKRRSLFFTHGTHGGREYSAERALALARRYEDAVAISLNYIFTEGLIARGCRRANRVI